MDVFKLKGSVELDIKDVVSGLDKVDQKVKSTDTSINKISDSSKKTSDAMSKMKKMGQNAMGTIDKWAKRGAIAVGVLASGILAMGIKGNAGLQQYTAGFTTLMGSADEANKHIADLKKFAASTPFEMGDLAKASTTLQAFGTDANNIMPNLKMLGDISLGNADKFDSLTLAFGQISSAGKMTGQDLNQLINAGFNPLQIISEKTGKSMETLRDEMAEGKISFEMVADAMKTATSEGGQFFGAMEEQSKTFDGMWSTIKDGAQNISQQVLKPIFDKIVEYMPKVIELMDIFSANIDNGKGTIEGMKDAIISVFGEDTYSKIMGVIGVVKNLTIAYLILKGVMAIATIINTLSTAYTALSGAMTALKGSTVAQTIAQWAMNSAWLASPITWIIAGIVAVIAIFVLLWNKCEGFREFWINLWEIIKSACGNAKDLIGDKIKSLVDGAKNKFGELKDGIMKPINWAKSKLKDAIETMKGFFKFDWSLPKIKLPHFNISGKFSLNPPSIPKFNVDWYSKGAIFTQPTVLGNIGVGDADNGKGSKAEAILPIDDLRDMIKDLLQVTIPLYIDSREFAKATAKPMKDEIDALQMRDVRLRY